MTVWLVLVREGKESNDMPQREWEITIGKDGSVELHLKGYKGKACLEVVKRFEALVGEVQERRETAEYYEPDEQVRYHIDLGH